MSSSTDFNNVMILKLLINDVSSFKRIFIEEHRYVNILILFYFFESRSITLYPINYGVTVVIKTGAGQFMSRGNCLSVFGSCPSYGMRLYLMLPIFMVTYSYVHFNLPSPKATSS